MLEQIYETLRGIIWHEFPKNGSGKPIVYDKVIEGWYIGDRTLISDTPAIVVHGSTAKPEDVASNLVLYTHTITVGLWTTNDNKEITERNILEMTRSLQKALLPHRRIWVLIKCPICNKKIFTPLHFTADHNNVFGAYATAVQTDLANTWLETHPSSDPLPSFIDSGIARAAYERVYEDVRNNIAVPNLSNSAKNTILAYQAKSRDPIRLLYDVRISDIKPSDDGVEKENLHGATFTITAKELVKQPAYGPDNVPTGSYD